MLWSCASPLSTSDFCTTYFMTGPFRDPAELVAYHDLKPYRNCRACTDLYGARMGSQVSFNNQRVQEDPTKTMGRQEQPMRWNERSLFIHAFTSGDKATSGSKGQKPCD